MAEPASEDAKAILQLQLNSEEAREKHGATVQHALRRLDAEIETVRLNANDYPTNPISADVWIAGAACADLARQLTNHFHAAGWLQCEETASALWAKATLAVCAHYHHLVGPAMLANADCHERLGQVERSSKLYAAVVRDFTGLLEAWNSETKKPTGEDRVALESLQTAVERLIAHGTTRLDALDLVSLRSRIKGALADAPDLNS